MNAPTVKAKPAATKLANPTADAIKQINAITNNIKDIGIKYSLSYIMAVSTRFELASTVRQTVILNPCTTRP